MKRFVLAAHEQGWGHRVRVNTIGSALLGSDHESRVTILARRDDAQDPRSWTLLPHVRSPITRTWATVTASVLVQDGLAFLDWRVRLMRRLGGKLVFVLQPWGFTPEEKVRVALEEGDLILVPFPPQLFQPEPPLSDVLPKVRVIPPVLNVGPVKRSPSSQQIRIYVLVTRPPPEFVGVLEEACRVAEEMTGKTVTADSRVGGLSSRESHLQKLATASVVVTQGATSAFEALHLGIPVVLVPLAQVPEQVMTARTLSEAGVTEYVPPEQLTGERLAHAILRSLEQHSDTARSVVPRSGTRDAVHELRALAGVEAPEGPGRTPRVSIISTNYNCGHALQGHLTSIYSQFDAEEFDCVVVDNHSTDGSARILEQWAATHPNFTWTQKRCTMGRGRELAARLSKAPFLVVVDTDTVYSPKLRQFVDRAIGAWPDHAVQAIYAAVFPRYLWRAAGGRGNFNSGEDFEMWMRLWRLGRIKWCPVRVGENMKEEWARDSDDFRSRRYSFGRRLWRLVRNEFDQLRLTRYQSLDLVAMWKANVVDLDLGPLETSWFGGRGRVALGQRIVPFFRRIWHLIQA